MPANVRNFWIEASVDGIQSTIATGPRAKDGGFSLTVKQRDQGGIIVALKVRGWIDKDGVLTLEADAMGKGDRTLTVITQR